MQQHPVQMPVVAFLSLSSRARSTASAFLRLAAAMAALSSALTAFAAASGAAPGRP